MTTRSIAARFRDAMDRFVLTMSVVGTEPVEIFSSAVTIGWGAMLMWPWAPPSFDTPSFRNVDAIGMWIKATTGIDGEFAIGAFCVWLGGTSIVSLLFGFYKTRIAAQYACFIWWLFALALVGTANPTLPGLAFYVGQAAMRLWTALRLLHIIRRPRYGLLGDTLARY